MKRYRPRRRPYESATALKELRWREVHRMRECPVHGRFYYPSAGCMSCDREERESE